MHAPEGIVLVLSWAVKLLSGEIYLDLFVVLKGQDCQFPCTNKNMSINSRNTGGKGKKKKIINKTFSNVYHGSVKQHTSEGI